MDISAFTAVAGGLNQSYNLAKALLDLRVDADATARIQALVTQLGELSGKFLAAQQAHMACHQKAMELEKEVAHLREFETEKQRYVLKALGPDSLAYALRDNEQGEEPLHYLCARCFQKAEKSMFQFAGYEKAFRVLSCDRCGGKVLIPEPSGEIGTTGPSGQIGDLSGY